jgi:hypothetical protein
MPSSYMPGGTLEPPSNGCVPVYEIAVCAKTFDCGLSRVIGLLVEVTPQFGQVTGEKSVSWMPVSATSLPNQAEPLNQSDPPGSLISSSRDADIQGNFVFLHPSYSPPAPHIKTQLYALSTPTVRTGGTLPLKRETYTCFSPLRRNFSRALRVTPATFVSVSAIGFAC